MSTMRLVCDDVSERRALLCIICDSSTTGLRPQKFHGMRRRSHQALHAGVADILTD